MSVIMQMSRPLATGLTFFFPTLLLAGLAARFWASEKAYGFTGPTHIAAGRESVYLFAAGDLHWLSLAGPNDLAFDDEGKLWLADTDNWRILELLPSDDGGYLPGREHSTVNRLTVGKRFYPMMLAQTADGRLWVTQAAEFSEPYADLLVYDPDDGAEAIVGLPDGAYATDVVALDDAVLVTDVERFTVYRVEIGTLAVGEFGDVTFRRHLAEIRKQRNFYDRLGTLFLAALILFGALMILTAVWATLKDKRWTKPPAPFDLASAPGQVPRTSGIHWLERDPKFDRSLKRAEQLGSVLFVAVITGALVLYLWIRAQAGPDPGEEVETKLNELGGILLLAGLVLVLIMPVIRFSTRAMKQRLGTGGKHLYIRLPNGRELAVDPSQLAYTGRVILYRQYTLPLQGGKQQSIYAPGEVQTWLAPLLRQARELTELQAMKHQWKESRGRRQIWWLAAGLVAVLVMFLHFISRG